MVGAHHSRFGAVAGIGIPVDPPAGVLTHVSPGRDRLGMGDLCDTVAVDILRVQGTEGRDLRRHPRHVGQQDVHQFSIFHGQDVSDHPGRLLHPRDEQGRRTVL
ncbi:Uncharacterised protein [uncultured Blautia sp.]|nr:Uncharacterised protein [uncultured Blautia sp.]